MIALPSTHTGVLPKRLNANQILPSLDEIKFTVCRLFTESQHNSSSHRQNVHSLRKLLSQCNNDSSMERQFFMSFVHCVMVILGLKKSDEVGTRMIRFAAGFIVYLAEHGDDTATRFIENFILFCLEHVDVKDKVVRMRLSQLLVACLNAVDELRVKMTERLFDKEASVKIHAIHAMSRLQGLALSEEGELEVIDIILDLLAHDPSVEVRRVALSQVDVTSKSLPTILERRHDLDSGIRRMFYAEKMKEIDLKMLTIQQRDEILQAGLSDRYIIVIVIFFSEESVRHACAEMIFNSWIQRTNSNLIEFLACLDVVTDTEVGEKALKNFFVLMPDMFHSFSEQYFANITVEMAFVLRVFCQHKKSTKNVEAVQDMLPELTILAKSVKRFYEYLVTIQDEVAKTDLEFIIRELLIVTEMCDFSDEVGRRTVIDVVGKSHFLFIDDILTNLELGEPVLEAAIKLLNSVCTRQEFLNKITELVTSFRDVYEPPSDAETLHRSLESLDINSSVPEHLRILANLKALDIIKYAMCVADFGLQPEMVTLLDHVIIPSINSVFAAVQTSGLRCLGLYGTVSKELTEEYMPLLIDFYLLAQGEVRNIALQSLFDWLMLFGVPSNDDTSQKSPLNTAIRALYDPSVEIQCIAAEGFVRLLLHRVHRDSQILEGLFHLYFHPSTAESPRLRQCLSYFFPAFSFIATDNQQMIQQVTPRVIHAWTKTLKQVNDAIPLTSVANQLFHLCDPINLIHGEKQFNPFAAIGIELAWLALADPQETTLCPIIARLNVDTDCPLDELKALLYLSTCLLKFNPNVALKKSVATLVECTGGEGLSQQEMSTLQERVKKTLPLGLSLIQHSTQQKTIKKKTISKKSNEIGNILDEIEDFNSQEEESE